MFVLNSDKSILEEKKKKRIIYAQVTRGTYKELAE